MLDDITSIIFFKILSLKKISFQKQTNKQKTARKQSKQEHLESSKLSVTNILINS